MNKDEHMKRAEEFNKDDCAYVHAEVTGGGTQLMVGGDITAIVYACYRTLQRCEQLSGMPFPVMLGTIEDMYNEEAENNAGNR